MEPNEVSGFLDIMKVQAQVLIVVMVSTWLVRWICLPKWPKGLPRVFALVPIVLGLVFTYLYIKGNRGLVPELFTEDGQMLVWTAAWRGILTSIAAIVLWQAVKYAGKKVPWLEKLDPRAWKDAGDDQQTPTPPAVLPILIIGVLLASMTTSWAGEKTLGMWGGSDSIAVACDTNWCGNVYVWPSTVNASVVNYVWIYNKGGAGDLAVSFSDKDTTAISGAFGAGWARISPGGEKTLVTHGRKVRVRAVRAGTSVPFEISIGR